MYDLSFEHKEYLINDKKIIWFWDENNHNASEIKENNLSICDSHYNELWNMKTVTNVDDSCVGVAIMEENLLYFVTFFGLGFTIDITNGSVIKKDITK
jgi:hypothetical protein